MASRTAARPTQPGEVRSSVITGYFTVPWDYPELRIPWEGYLAKFIEQETKAGWRFERVEQLTQDPIPTFNPDGEGRKTFIMRVRFSRPARKLVMEMPDNLAAYLVNKHGNRFQYAGAVRP